jgi:hypothetical protein
MGVNREYNVLLKLKLIINDNESAMRHYRDRQYRQNHHI